ncbi:MAG: transcriptional regulator [Acidobacteria bacterium]|nr:transcriptional regulator [Acidobacteriota bacterium]
MVRYRFSGFVLSPQQRRLVRDGQEVPLIPRYFDLLLLLIERRHEAVHRQEIFDRVWTDAIVSESALSQAVRTVRRTLGDDPREPRFIRTVSRHGYRFVFPDVVEEADEGVTQPLQRADESSDEEDAEIADNEADRSPWHRAAQAAVAGWPRAAVGSAMAGLVAGGVGGLILAAAPGSNVPLAVAPVLAAVAALAGAAGGTGVGAGLAAGESLVSSRRVPALTLGAALGGGAVGLTVQWLARWGLSALVGLDLDVGGGIEGVVIGGCAGFGFAIATRRGAGESAEPRGERWHAALVTAAICALAGLALTVAGRPLAGGTIHAVANATDGARASLEPLGRLIGEPGFGPLSRAIAACGECASFGFGLALGVLRRSPLPRPAASKRV